jgi:predicted nucleic acid-binding protein
MSDFLDTSAVVRYLTADPPQLAEKARTLIEGPTQFQITETVLLESAHVLRTVYGIAREDVVDLLTALVARPNIRVHGIRDSLVAAGLALTRPSGRVSLGDALIWAVASQESPSRVHTFDQRFPATGIEVRLLGETDP